MRNDRPSAQKSGRDKKPSRGGSFLVEGALRGSSFPHFLMVSRADLGGLVATCFGKCDQFLLKLQG